MNYLSECWNFSHSPNFHASLRVMSTLEVLSCQFAVLFFHVTNSFILLFLLSLLIYSFSSFHTSFSRCSLSDCMSPQFSWTLLNSLADLNNDVVQMVSILPDISKSSSPVPIHLVTVPIAQITIGITVTSMFYSIFNSLARSRYLSLFFIFFQFDSVVCRDSKVHNSAISFFLVNYY